MIFQSKTSLEDSQILFKEWAIMDVIVTCVYCHTKMFCPNVLAQYYGTSKNPHNDDKAELFRFYAPIGCLNCGSQFEDVSIYIKPPEEFQKDKEDATNEKRNQS